MDDGRTGAGAVSSPGHGGTDVGLALLSRLGLGLGLDGSAGHALSLGARDGKGVSAGLALRAVGNVGRAVSDSDQDGGVLSGSGITPVGTTDIAKDGSSSGSGGRGDSGSSDLLSAGLSDDSGGHNGGDESREASHC